MFLLELAHTFFFFLLTPLENIAFFRYKMTCCFSANNVLFYHKRRVVSLKMNMCFWGCCDTCDSKKQKSCRMRVCYARVYVCVARGEDRLRIIDSFCCVCVAKILVSNLEMAFFCRFFTLFPHIYPYSIGGRI